MNNLQLNTNLRPHVTYYFLNKDKEVLEVTLAPITFIAHKDDLEFYAGKISANIHKENKPTGRTVDIPFSELDNIFESKKEAWEKKCLLLENEIAALKKKNEASNLLIKEKEEDIQKSTAMKLVAEFDELTLGTEKSVIKPFPVSEVYSEGSE
jgi:hypothetical protein